MYHTQCTVYLYISTLHIHQNVTYTLSAKCWLSICKIHTCIYIQCTCMHNIFTQKKCQRVQYVNGGIPVLKQTMNGAHFFQYDICMLTRQLFYTQQKLPPQTLALQQSMKSEALLYIPCLRQIICGAVMKIWIGNTCVDYSKHTCRWCTVQYRG